jgi:hypothetical protein
METHFHFTQLELEFPGSDMQLELDVHYPVGAGCSLSRYLVGARYSPSK